MNFIEVEEGEHGFFYVTSPYVPGLFIAAPTIEEAYREVPLVIVALAEANRTAPQSPPQRFGDGTKEGIGE